MPTHETLPGREPARRPPRGSDVAARAVRPNGFGLFASVVVTAVSATVLTVLAEPPDAGPACAHAPEHARLWLPYAA
jgi:hypothetical protein